MFRKLAIGCGVFIGLAIIAVVAALIYFNSVYGLTDAPRITHAEVLDPKADVRLIIQPAKALDLVAEVIRRTQQDLQPGAEPYLEYFLPNEIALTMDINDDKPVFDTALFVNERKFGRVIAEGLSPMLMNSPSTTLRWNPPGMTVIRRGVLEARGEYAIPEEIVKEWEADWWTGNQFDALEVKSVHFIETIIDNRDGALFIPMKMVEDPNMSDMEKGGIYSNLKTISDLRITIDPIGTESFAINVTANFKEDAREKAPNGVRNLLNIATSEARAPLQQNLGLNLDGEAEVVGRSVVGEFTLGPQSRLLELMTGNQGGAPDTAMPAPASQAQ